jgi:hypothetical protein
MSESRGNEVSVGIGRGESTTVDRREWSWCRIFGIARDSQKRRQGRQRYVVFRQSRQACGIYVYYHCGFWDFVIFAIFYAG